MNPTKPSDAAEPLPYWEGEPVRVWEQLWDVPELTVFDSIPSTNAWMRARNDLPAWSTAIAEEQRAGRGRGGSGWVSPRGGLWMSVHHRPRARGRLPLVPLRVGLALSRAIGATCEVEVALKWPNDLWMDGRKLGGILVEASGEEAVIGIGLNVGSTPDPELCRTPPVSLREVAGRDVSRSKLVGAILRECRIGLDRAGAVLRDEERRALEARDALAGRSVRVTPGPAGIAKGIDSKGRLRIETGQGIETVTSGTIELI